MRGSLVPLIAVLGLGLLAGSALAASPSLPDHPLTLDDCISIALQQSPSLVIAQQDVISGEAYLQSALSSYYPEAFFIATRGRTRGSSFVDTPAGTIAFSTAATRREAEVLLSHTIWQTGRSQSVQQARSSLAASSANAEATQQDLMLSIYRLYYAALAAEEFVGVAEATLASARDHANLVQARATVGEAAPVDVLPAEASVADAQFVLLQARNGADIAKAQLKREMGVPPTYPLQLAPPLESTTHTAIPALAEALRLAMDSRPEIASINQAVVGAEQSVRLAEITKNGVLSLSAQYNRGISGPQEGDSWSVVASATAFLFDGGARRAEVDAARARLRSLHAQRQLVVNGIGLEVESALLNAQTAAESTESAEMGVGSAEAQLAGAEAKYREGVGIFVEILDAEEAVARARSNRVQAVYDYQTAMVELRKALGLLTPSADNGVAP
jgi:outer membrane protein